MQSSISYIKRVFAFQKGLHIQLHKDSLVGTTTVACALEPASVFVSYFSSFRLADSESDPSN